MEFTKPVKVAFGQLEHIAFIKRHLDVYKKPDINQYPIAAYEFDFLDFIYSLVQRFTDSVLWVVGQDTAFSI
ncbi:hypothetical protein EKM59_11705 [Legionella septentrionalis]|uniref:Uncharacterized protein n=1 Tax=Legionella septentrionalis TaxID=2498109 RepID=A0A433JGB8_9GAMM|nr:hypothetical protein EKM59_11705 [Legionella septentrionalis]